MNRSEISAGHSASSPASVGATEPATPAPAVRPEDLFAVANHMEASIRRVTSLVGLLDASVDQVVMSDREMVDRMVLQFEALTAALHHELAELDELNQGVYAIHAVTNGLLARRGGEHA